MSQEYSQAFNTQINDELVQAQPQSSMPAVSQKTTAGASIQSSKAIKRSLPKKNSFVLSYSDSVKLNLITQASGTNTYFESNVLTRSITPLEQLRDDQLLIWVDSLATYRFKAEILKSDSIRNNPPLVTVSDSASVTINDSLIVETPKVEISKPLRTESTTYIAKDQKILPTSSFQDSKLFLLIIVLFSLGLLGYMRIKSSRFLKTIFKGLFSHHESHKLFTTVNIRNSMHSVMLDLLFSINMGILIYEITAMMMSVRGYIFSLAVFAGSVAAVAFYFLTKNFLYRLVGFIFSTKEDTNEYLFFVGIVTKTYGIIITPILVILPFTTGSATYITIAIAIALYAFLYLIQLFRALKIILKKAISLFYYILYLCTLEILPFIIAYRILNK